MNANNINTDQSIFNNSSTSSTLHFGGLNPSVNQGLSLANSTPNLYSSKFDLPYLESIRCIEKI